MKCTDYKSKLGALGAYLAEVAAATPDTDAEVEGEAWADLVIGAAEVMTGEPVAPTFAAYAKIVGAAMEPPPPPPPPEPAALLTVEDLVQHLLANGIPEAAARAIATGVGAPQAPQAPVVPAAPVEAAAVVQARLSELAAAQGAAPAAPPEQGPPGAAQHPWGSVRPQAGYDDYGRKVS